MTDPSNPYGPYINWTTFNGWESSAADSVKDASGQVKSAFYLGYTVTHLPGGRLAEIFGAKKIVCLSMLLSTLLAIATPLVCYLSLSPSGLVWVLYTIQMVLGLLQGVLYPSFSTVVSQWAPLSEKAKFIAFMCTGQNLGIILTYPLCGLIMEYLSWTWVFYITSLITFAWLVLWFLLMSDYPEKDRLIGKDELNYILKSRLYNAQQMDQDKLIPLLPLILDVLKSGRMWVVIVVQFCIYLGYSFIIIEGPDFLSKILPLGKEISSNGLYSALPFLSMSIIGPTVAIVVEYAISRKIISLINGQRLCLMIGTLIPAAGLIGMTYLTAERHQYYCIALLSISFGFFGSTYSGIDSNINGLAPNRDGNL